ncbi:MAG: protein O-mannosyl-transferase family [Gemmatimonadaceae bacterium]
MKRPDAAIAGAVVLLLVYAFTLAPGVTFWDAGEFIAAAHSLGIPHPPGTPLYVLLVNVWCKVFFFLPYAVASNLFSAAATALAAFLSARLVLRARGTAPMAFAAAVTAGAMSTAWVSATETEVYAASLALGLLMIWAGERAGSSDDATHARRWTWLTAYLIALAVPLHLSALVAAPAAIALASYVPPRTIRWGRAILLAGAVLLSMGVGRMSLTFTVAGALVMLLAHLRSSGSVWSRSGFGVTALLLCAAGVSALAFLYVRAQFDPVINQGDPSTWRAFTDMVARRQYDVAPIWPRKAPWWVQFGNLGQYADWQTALSLGPTVMPSIARSLLTAIFLAFGFYGALTQWRRDRRGFAGTLVLFVCGTIAVLIYLNLHPGPSIGWGILPDTHPHEARERDYFYVFGFWAWGMWAGLGAVALVQRFRRPAWAGVLVACLPIALNWRAVTRRSDPESRLPLALARAFLESTPRNGVLFVAGDNDSYPLWYAQEVKDMRPDVAIITVPLLPTQWYRAQIAGRFGLLDSSEVRRYPGKWQVAATIADGASERGRPIAAAMTLSSRDRTSLRAGTWSPSGLVYVPDDPPDTTRARELDAWIEQELGQRQPRAAIDPVNSYFRRMLNCPRSMSDSTILSDSTRLDSVCNYR